MKDPKLFPAGKIVSLPVRWVGIATRAVVGPPARAVRGTARRVADPARQVVDYFASERATLRQGFIALIVATLTSLIAGITLAVMDQRIEAVTGVFVLIPVSIGMRGNIFGALSARLGTSIHSGLFDASFERNGLLYQNVWAAASLTITTSLIMAVLGRAIAGLLGIATVSVWDFIVIAMVGGVLSSAIVLAVTVVLSLQAFRRGWDLDSVAAPLITAIGDVVTLPLLFAATFLIDIPFLVPITATLAIAAAVIALYKGWTARALVVRRIVRESIAVLTLAIVLDILAGTVVQPRMEAVFLPFPALLMVIPGFLENTGALGGILSARLGSKLHLGAMTPSAKPEAPALMDAAFVFVLGLIVYALTALTTLPLAELMNEAYPGALRFIGVNLLGGAMATAAAAIIGYYAAIATYRFGLDPDNHTIPLVTSGMDLLGIICLVAALTIFGVT